MSSTRMYPPRSWLGLILLGLGNASCRMPNPAFDLKLRVDPTQASTASSSANTQDTRPKSEAASTSKEIEQTGTTAESSPTTASSTSSTDQPANTSSEDTNEAAARAYCQKGSIACYPMFSVDGDRFKDHNASALHMPASGLSIVDAKRSHYPFTQVVNAAPQGQYRSSASYKIPSSGSAGFDLWLRPTRPDSKNWTAFAIDNYISLIRLSDGDLRCAFEGSSLIKFMDRPFTAKEGELHHIACAFDGASKQMWVDGNAATSTNAIPNKWPTSAQFIFGWKSAVENPFDGHIGAIRVWDNIQAMESTLEQMFPQ